MLAATVCFALAPVGLVLAQAPTRVQVRLILLDTVVADRKGHPVAGLHQEDFDLLVDNERVPIHSFEEKCPGLTAEDKEAAVAAAGGASPRNSILVFDFSHLMVISRRNAIRAARRFIDEGMASGDRVMILALKRGLYMISGFTEDRDILAAKLSSLLDDPAMTDTAALSEENSIERLVKEFGIRSRDITSSLPGRRPAGGAEQECKAEARMSERETASSLRLLASAMPAFAEVSGRKAMILFTETLRDDPGLPYYEACGIGMLARPSNMLTVQPEMEDLVRKANLAGVSFYPVHAGGIGAGPTSPSRHSATGFQAHIALSTGGSHSVLMKDDQLSFRQAAQDMSCHYVIGYLPEETIDPGDHVVSIAVRGPGMRVRHRQSFTVQTAREASESQMLAALATPGLKRDLGIETRAYAMGEGRRRERRVLLKVSVPARDLVGMRLPDGGRHGSVQIRGGILSKDELRCSFTRDVPFQGATEPDSGRRIGVEMMCAVPEGEHEIVVAARDEGAGSMGTFWGKLRVGSPRLESRTLLWAGAGPDVWLGEEPASLFVRASGSIHENESARVTSVACLPKGSRSSLPEQSPSGSMVLDGPVRLQARVRAIFPEEAGGCRVVGGDIQQGALVPGHYRVLLELDSPWQAVGSPAEFEVTTASP
jgi:VWFA-related protein